MVREAAKMCKRDFAISSRTKVQRGSQANHPSPDFADGRACKVHDGLTQKRDTHMWHVPTRFGASYRAFHGEHIHLPDRPFRIIGFLHVDTIRCCWETCPVAWEKCSVNRAETFASARRRVGTKQRSASSFSKYLLLPLLDALSAPAWM